MKKINYKIITGFILLFLFFSLLGISKYNLNADVSRDLSELSNLLVGKILWLGPHLRVGFPASPVYYYILAPLLFLTNSAYSTVITQVLIVTISLYLYYSFQKESNYKHIVVILFFSLSPWLINSTINPWNGYMYISWLLLTIFLLWYKKPVIFSSLAYGISVAIHPAALLFAPIYFYEILVSKSKKILVKIFSVLFGLLVPWLPIIIFEFLSKGFLFKEWLKNKDTGMFIQPGFHNIQNIINLMGINKMLLFLIVISSLFYSLKNKRLKIWYLLILISIIFLFIISSLHIYYLLPVVCALFFIISQSLYKHKLGIFLLIISILLFVFNIYKTYSINLSWPPENRLERISNTVIELEKMELINQSETYALISLIDAQNSTPQADDYRFVFRTNKYKALNIDEYPTADNLIIFFENDQKDPENWSDWHSNYFGDKEIVLSKEINSTHVIKYKRK